MLAQVAACRSWIIRLKRAGVILMIPVIALDEVRRELIRIEAAAQLARLATLVSSVRSIPVTPEAWLKAAEFWAFVRKAGRPTAAPQSLDEDAILAGVAATIGSPGNPVVIATTNVGHLSRFPGIDARPWEQIS